MPRRTATKVASAILLTLGLASLLAGYFSDRIWAQADQVAAHAAVADAANNAVITDPGVLNLVNTDVTIRATVPDNQPVTLVVGRDVDVNGWVGDAGAAQITGLADWDTLAVAVPTSVDPVPDPAGSDLWVAEASGNGTVEMQWEALPGRWSMMAVGTGTQRTVPEVDLVWPRTAAMPWRWPLIGAGVALSTLGAALALFGPRKRVPELELPAAIDMSERTSPWVPVNAPQEIYVNAPEEVYLPAGVSEPVAVVAAPEWEIPSRRDLRQSVGVVPAEMPPPPMPNGDVTVVMPALAPQPAVIVEQVAEQIPFVAPPVSIQRLPEAEPIAVVSEPVVVRESVFTAGAPVVPQPEPVAAAAAKEKDSGLLAQGRVFASETTFDAPAPSSRREVKMLRRVGDLTGNEPIIPPVVVHEWPADWVIQIAEVAE